MASVQLFIYEQVSFDIDSYEGLITNKNKNKDKQSYKLGIRLDFIYFSFSIFFLFTQLSNGCLAW